MFAILNKLFGVRSAKSQKTAGVFQPVLEALESREMLSAAGYSNGGLKEFYIDSNTLYERDAIYGTNVHALATSVAQVSVLRDSPYDHNSARADVLKVNGDLLQWDDATGWKNIASGVKQVWAGNKGNSAVVFTSFYLSLYNTDTNSWNSISGGIASASIGQDLHGDPMLGMVTISGYGYEWRANGGLESLGGDIKQISAGQFGHTAVLFNSSDVWDHLDAQYVNYNGNYNGSGSWALIARGAASTSSGTNVQGDVIIDVVFTDGTAQTHNGMSNTWISLGSGVQEANAGWYGESYVSYSDGNINRFNENTYGGCWMTSLVVHYSTNRNFAG
jgi:hypothetical protein